MTFSPSVFCGREIRSVVALARTPIITIVYFQRGFQRKVSKIKTENCAIKITQNENNQTRANKLRILRDCFHNSYIDRAINQLGGLMNFQMQSH